MIVEKPEPLQIGDKFYFTLSSYDPVSVEVTVPFTTDADVDYALQGMVAREGAKPEDITDAWVAEHYDGVESVAQLKELIRPQLEQLNASYAEDQKQAQCVTELAKRLVQKVPDVMVEQYREILRAQFEQEVSQGGLSEAEFLARLGGSASDLDGLFLEQGRKMAEEFAALDAFAEERKLSVADDEIAGLLALPQESAEQLVADAKEHHQLEQVRTSALRNKAADVVVAECSCTYHHETPEEAEKRIAAYQQFTSAEAADAAGAEAAASGAAGGTDDAASGTDAAGASNSDASNSDFKLV